MNAVLKSVALCLVLVLVCGGAGLFLSPSQVQAKTESGLDGVAQAEQAQPQAYWLWIKNPNEGGWQSQCSGTYEFCLKWSEQWERRGYYIQILPYGVKP